MTKNVISGVTLQCSLSSRIAILGANGAGKSTMVKALIGELDVHEGVVWKHPNLRVAYVAQHAFHHIEKVRSPHSPHNSDLDCSLRQILCHSSHAVFCCLQSGIVQMMSMFTFPALRIEDPRNGKADSQADQG